MLQFVQGDAFELLGQMNDASIGGVFTDIPYASLEKHRSKGTTTRLAKSKASSNEWFPVIPNARLPHLMAELYRVLKPNTHCYVMCDQETMFHLKPAGELAGFTFWKPIIWDKATMGMGYHYRCQYEVVLFFEKGKRQLNNLGIADVIRAKRVHNGYPTEKPVELIKTVLSNSMRPDEVWLDPFCGSGATLAAADELGLNAMGFDVGHGSRQHVSNRFGERLTIADADGELFVRRQQLQLFG